MNLSSSPRVCLLTSDAVKMTEGQLQLHKAVSREAAKPTVELLVLYLGSLITCKNSLSLDQLLLSFTVGGLFFFTSLDVSTHCEEITLFPRPLRGCCLCARANTPATAYCGVPTRQ